MTKLRKTVSSRLRKLRLLQGYNQTELANLSRLTYCAISHFETGRRMPCLRNLVALADALGVTTDYILGRDQ